jgi:uncharacterized repeat protein (TIGR01451 family)
MQSVRVNVFKRIFLLIVAAAAAFMLAAGLLVIVRGAANRVYAASASPQAPIPPPEGYPKFNRSLMQVSPGWGGTSGKVLHFRIELVNTGAYAADGVSLVNPLPVNSAYNAGSAQSDTDPQPTVFGNVLTWSGNVGFDSRVVINYSVTVMPGFSGMISNTADINHPLIPEPVSVSAEAIVTDNPLFTISKSALPRLPGAGKPLEYALQVTSIGQPATDLNVIVSDYVPQNTIFRDAGQGGLVSQNGRQITWQQPITLVTGASSVFTFSVDIGAVPSGTVISNDSYQVSWPENQVSAGEPYTVTVVDPVLYISKTTWPDPPGSNRELTYTLTVLNRGSLATDLVVTDRLPDGVIFVRGGSYQAGTRTVRWNLSELDSGEVAEVFYVVDVGDVAEVSLLNSQYGVCSAEGVCTSGDPLASLVKGPQFEADIWVDPIAKKPGGGTGPVTPTIVIRNLGPGSALDATAQLIFGRISVSFNDLLQEPPVGKFYDGPGCGEKCVSYLWKGDLSVGETVTLTTIEGQSTIGGEEGTHYTATLVMSDQLGDFTTEPYTATAIGRVTHYANLIPSKSAQSVIGAGQVMTYVLQVYNSGLSTDVPPYPVLTDTVPASTTLVRVNDGGTTAGVGDDTVISWDLPAMSPGDRVYRSFAVQVDSDLVSGTQIVNNQYGTKWYEIDVSGYFSNTGEPVTTTVKEVGLIDSFKSVEPEVAHPGENNVLTYTVHVVNSSPSSHYGVTVYDLFPWQDSTYLRDAIASAGSLISDIVSLDWVGDIAANSQQLITFSVLVDPFFEGALTNTVTIDHSSLGEPVRKSAVAYITDKPVLSISKTASPDPVPPGEELSYQIRVENLGQQATVLVLTDTLPANTAYIPGSSTAGGQLQGDTLRWTVPVLAPGEVRTFTFRVNVLGGRYVINDRYRISCAEGVSTIGEPVITEVDLSMMFLPAIYR